tara:strand:- start:13003 stop:13302 length:300 start_codon:yes stop_codon:yes gene_type:complete
MSDSITKWHEMQENKKTRSVYPGDAYITDTTGGDTTFIYESPDGGKTVTRRPFGGDIADREVIQKPATPEVDKQAYSLLVNYNEDVILRAAEILNKVAD